MSGKAAHEMVLNGQAAAVVELHDESGASTGSTKCKPKAAGCFLDLDLIEIERRLGSGLQQSAANRPSRHLRFAIRCLASPHPILIDA
jgi:hypothetical protein